jgi:hypothetical protein
MENKKSIESFLNYRITAQIILKKLKIRKKLLSIFLKRPHQKINEKNTFLALTYSKIMNFSKFKKQLIN